MNDSIYNYVYQGVPYAVGADFRGRNGRIRKTPACWWCAFPYHKRSPSNGFGTRRQAISAAKEIIDRLSA